MNISCDVIKDLLPLYVENLTSKDSNKIIDEHIEVCEDCNDALLVLKSEFLVSEPESQLSEKSSANLFRRIRNKMILFIGVTMIIGIFIGIFGGEIRTRYLAYTSADNFFQNLTKGDYEEAFKYLHYYEVSDIKSAISYDQAEAIWIDRVTRLKEEGVYVKDYSELKVWTDDTYPQGTVTLTIVKNEEESVYKADLWFDASRKLGNIYRGSEQTELEEAISGYLMHE